MLLDVDVDIPGTITESEEVFTQLRQRCRYLVSELVAHTHTYIHTYMHTYIHAYIHMHTYVHPCANDEQHCMRRGVNLHDTDFESVPLFSPGYGPHFRVLPACIVQQVSS